MRQLALTSIPRVAIADLPTPVVSSIGACTGLPVERIWVKRDDVSGHPYGGNKVRKLEFLLGEARAQGARSVVTFGAVGSNHVLATATYGAREGFDVHAVLTPQRMTPYLPRNLRADLDAGATLHLAEDADDARERASALSATLTERDGVPPFVIPMGGTSALGTIGFVNAAMELADQIDAGEVPEPDVLYVPFGSMGTAAGLAIGLFACGIRTKVVGVRVVPTGIANEETLGHLVDVTVAKARSADASFPLLRRIDLALDVREEFFGEEYAHATDASIEAVAAAREWGLALETTYTGKAMAALLADYRDGSTRDSVVMFWNTYSSRPLGPPTPQAAGVPSALRPYLEGSRT